ncbi:hypothetical protein PXD04_05570 [Methanosphaera sp. ISO3-F5]|nr:hypothetical protein [Methanosphaera sp. ISO3-F5]WQH65237.1 hypothetical protein PXD04_05570 [Methanosphaera sp. ISO3-F5]
MWKAKYRVEDKSDVSAVENTITVSLRGGRSGKYEQCNQLYYI